jgi:hypothetical protein
VLSDGVRLEIERVFVDEDTAIAELYSTSTTTEGAPFANRYCWVCGFDPSSGLDRRPTCWRRTTLSLLVVHGSVPSRASRSWF